MNRRMLFIYNPMSGRGVIGEHLSEILRLYSASQYEIVIHATQKRMDAATMAQHYAEEGLCDLIICAGGDGTLDEVAGGVLKSGKRVPVGYIPAGSTNDFGYSLGITSNIFEAAATALEGRAFPCDIAAFNDSFFTYTAAFGLFSDVSYDTPQNIKNAFGHMAYILNGMTKLSGIKNYHTRVTYDGIQVEEDYLVGMVVSSNSVGGFKGITGENVELDDGLHELILVRNPHSIAGITVAVNELLSHRYNEKYVRYAKVSEVKFSFDEPVAWSLDGEFGGTHKHAHITVKKQGIDYMVK